MINKCYFCGITYQYDHQIRCKFRKKSSISLYRYLLDIVEKFKIPIGISKNEYYNGKYIPIPKDIDRSVFLNLFIHELAHWLYATPEERKDSFFGLTIKDDVQESQVFKIERLLAKQTAMLELELYLKEIRFNI